jgi:hypothetical protein
LFDNNGKVILKNINLLHLWMNDDFNY